VKIFSVLIVFLLMAGPSPASAMTYYLQNDLGVRDNQHLCRYSNGKVYAFNATELCKMSVEDSSLDTRGQATGFKVGEYQDGLTKVCVYNVLGGKQAIRIGSVELCPLSYQF
jgi:hypothetical protein